MFFFLNLKSEKYDNIIDQSQSNMIKGRLN